MLTEIVYNCNRGSLGDVGETEFSEAFENEARVRPLYRDLLIDVQFSDSPSGIVAITADDEEEDKADPKQYDQTFNEFGEKAFNALLAAK